MHAVRIFHIPDRYVVPIVLIPLGAVAIYGGFANIVLWHADYRVSNFISCSLIALVSFGSSYRWWTANIKITDSEVVVRKLFKSITFPLDDVESFVFVGGKYFSYTYVGLLKNQSVLARTSYGPMWTISLIPKEKRLVRWLDELNRALREARMPS